MTYNQVYEYTNQAVKEALGTTAVLKEDLSNIVDIGNELFNNKALDKYANALIDHIGKVIFVDRVYTRRAPSVLMDAWEYGQVLEKIRVNMVDAEDNDSWELTDGQSYDENVFKKPVVSAKFYDKRVTFEIDISIPSIQVKGAFSSAEQMGGFISMIYTMIQNSLELRLEKLVMGTICGAVAETYNADIGAGTPAETTGIKAVNLLKLYNTEKGGSLTADKALSDPEFIRFASLQILLYSDKLTSSTPLFNVGKTEKFTPKEKQKIILLSEFSKRADVYLQSDVWHNELTRLPAHDDVMYWQGTGTDFALANTAKVDVALPSNKTKEVIIPKLLGVIFDRDALGVANFDKRITSKWNAKGEFTNYFYKVDAGYFVDTNENLVCFFIA